MRRRTGPQVVVLALALLAAPLAAEAQQAGKVHRIGWLGPPPWAQGPFLDELNRLGWTDGRNLTMEYRWPPEKGQYEQLPALAAELVGLEVDLIVSVLTVSTHAAARATASIPIVFSFVSDPVGDGFVQSLARPGRNLTGVSNVAHETSAKIVQLLAEAGPELRSLAYLWSPSLGRVARRSLEETRAATDALGVTLHSVEVREPGDFARAFDAIEEARPDGLIVLQDPALTQAHRPRILEFAHARRLPVMANGQRTWVEAGALMNYWPDTEALFRRTAYYVDRVLRGANPAELPVEQPTKFLLTVNLKTAKALGLTIPPSILVRADGVIE